MCGGVIPVARDDNFSIPITSAAADCVENTIILYITQRAGFTIRNVVLQCSCMEGSHSESTFAVILLRSSKYIEIHFCLYQNGVGSC